MQPPPPPPLDVVDKMPFLISFLRRNMLHIARYSVLIIYYYWIVDYKKKLLLDLLKSRGMYERDDDDRVFSDSDDMN